MRCVTDSTPSDAQIKRMRLRYQGICARCGYVLTAGVTADYDRAAKTVSCVRCPSGEPRAVSQGTVAQTPVEQEGALHFVDGVAGVSARREFERRHDARQERVRARFPRMGRVLLAVFGDLQSTTAWASGAGGEERLGGMLQQIAGPSLRVLHDRRIPGTRANIDHLVVCPAGVFVIDAKRYRNARPELRVRGGLFSPRRELLCVGGRDRTKLVEGMRKQVAVVEAALTGHPDVPVRGVLCFIEADWRRSGPMITPA